MTAIGFPAPAIPATDHLATEGDIIIVRVLNAPRTMVFRAWTDPVDLAQWWGPYGSSDRVCEVDPFVGGRWKVAMRSPQGVEHSTDAMIEDLVPSERLMLRMDPTAYPAGHLRTTVLFEELDDLTRLTVRQSFASAEDRDIQLRSGACEHWGQSFDSLEELLIKGSVA